MDSMELKEFEIGNAKYFLSFRLSHTKEVLKTLNKVIMSRNPLFQPSTRDLLGKDLWREEPKTFLKFLI